MRVVIVLAMMAMLAGCDAFGTKEPEPQRTPSNRAEDLQPMPQNASIETICEHTKNWQDRNKEHDATCIQRMRKIRGELKEEFDDYGWCLLVYFTEKAAKRECKTDLGIKREEKRADKKSLEKEKRRLALRDAMLGGDKELIESTCAALDAKWNPKMDDCVNKLATLRTVLTPKGLEVYSACLKTTDSSDTAAKSCVPLIDEHRKPIVDPEALDSPAKEDGEDGAPAPGSSTNP